MTDVRQQLQAETEIAIYNAMPEGEWLGEREVRDLIMRVARLKEWNSAGASAFLSSMTEISRRLVTRNTPGGRREFSRNPQPPEAKPVPFMEAEAARNAELAAWERAERDRAADARAASGLQGALAGIEEERRRWRELNGEVNEERFALLAAEVKELRGQLKELRDTHEPAPVGW